MTRIIWTPLPARVEPGGYLKVSTFISPQIVTGSQDLQNLPEMFRDWPARINEMTFRFNFNGSIQVADVDRITQPDSNLWKKLFEDVQVKSFSYHDDSEAAIVPSGSFVLQESIREQYANFAISSSISPPWIENIMSSDLPSLAPIPEEEFLADPKFADQVQEGLIIGNLKINPEKFKAEETPPAKQETEKGLAFQPQTQAARKNFQSKTDKFSKKRELLKNIFVTNKSDIETLIAKFKTKGIRKNDLPGSPSTNSVLLMKQSLGISEQPGPKIDEKWLRENYDFHSILSMLTDYPELMRRLGLLIDFKFSSVNIPESTISNPKWLFITSDQFTTDDKSIRTAYLYSSNYFGLAPAEVEPRIDGGMFTLDDQETYKVVQVDAEGTIFKIESLIRTLTNRIALDEVGNNQEALPTINSGGISVEYLDKNIPLEERIGRMNTAQYSLDKQTPVVFAQDLTRGYIVDIWDSVSRKWNSLCKRIGTYELKETGAGVEGFVEIEPPIAPDEGWVEPSARIESALNQLYLNDSLFRWTGWSLSSLRPGRTIGLEDRAEDVRNDPLPQIGLRINFRPEPFTLPRLRFGRNYKVRCRAVDLAGNAVEIDNAGDSHSTPEFKYLRFESLLPPLVILTGKINPKEGPGESHLNLVIRSYNRNQSMDSEPTSETSERHIFPPKTFQYMAELHGKFDDPSTGLVRNDIYSELVSRIDEGKFQDSNEAGDKDVLHGSMDSKAKGVVTYYPDPLAKGVSLQGLPGIEKGNVMKFENDGSLVFLETNQQIPSSLAMIDFGESSNWPDLKPFRFKIVGLNPGENAAPHWNPQERILTIKIPKSEKAEISLSTFTGDQDLELMGLWDWMNESDADDEVKRHAQLGIHSMISPPTKLTLVHAVQQPLGIPEINELEASRQVGETFVRLSGAVDIHEKSTSMIQIHGSWNDPFDGKFTDNTWNENPDTDLINGKSIAFEKKIPDVSKFSEPINPKGKHFFKDTKHRIVNYKIISTSRFKNNFFQKDLEFTRDSPTFPVSIPSSSRPAKVRISYVIPTFGWEEREGVEQKISIRKGKGLRVYIERPWHSSGEGELLAVIIKEGTAEMEKVMPFVTLRASDPIWDTSTVDSVPSIESFTARSTREDAVGRDLLLAELPDLPPPDPSQPVVDDLELPGSLEDYVIIDDIPVGKSFQDVEQHFGIEEDINQEAEINPGPSEQLGGPYTQGLPQTLGIIDQNTPRRRNRVIAVGHEVHFDKERNLWYSDIEVDPENSYYPFIRLSLARYQPDSVDDVEISPVALAEFSQIAPDRTLTLIRDPINFRRFQVTISGVTYRARKGLPVLTEDFFGDSFLEGGGKIEITVEKPDESISNELVWREVESVAEQESGQPSDILWSGTVTIPESEDLPSRFRLVIKEFERFTTRSDGRRWDHTEAEISAMYSQVKRLVYADILNLNF